MTYPLTVDRRQRRRRNLVLLSLLALVVIVVALAVQYRTERRETTDYLSLAQELADRELDMATSLTGLMTSIGDLERPDILVRLESLAAESAAVAAELDEAAVARPVAEASGLFSVAVAGWAEGIDALDEAFVAVLDGADDDPTGDVMLSSAFDDLRVGDAAYRRFLVAVDSIDAEVTRAEFPVVAFTAGDSEPLFDAVTIARRLRTIRKLDERHDVAVTAGLEPSPVTDPNGIRVVPFAADYAVVAVLTNEGNVAEEAIEVALRISPAGGAEPVMRTRVVPFLDAGQATSLAFEAITLAPGEFYELLVTVSIAEDADADDNAFELPFLTNEAA
jgi:hypothetical protein